MKKSLMPFEAFKLAIKTMEGKNPGMPGWQITDHFPREGGILIEHGFLVEGPVDTVVPNRSNYDHDFVEAEWNEVTGGYQYYSFDDNRWIDVPAEDLKTYRLDMERVVRHIQELVGITGNLRLVCRDLLWNLGTIWFGSKKVTLFLARNFSKIATFDKVCDSIRRQGDKSPGLVLAWEVPGGRNMALPYGHRMLGLKEAMIVEGDNYQIDMGLIRGVLTGEREPVDDLAPVKYSIDFSTVRVHDREFVFKGIKQQEVVGILINAYHRGEFKCRTSEVLGNVNASDKSNTLSKLFSGRTDWKELIGYGGGFCWLKV